MIQAANNFVRNVLLLVLASKIENRVVLQNKVRKRTVEKSAGSARTTLTLEANSVNLLIVEASIELDSGSQLLFLLASKLD